jgi:N-methylhydantoinase B
MKSFDPIDLAVFKSATRSVAEEMGAALRRTAFSPNIKERRDYSCAIFDGGGQLIAMGDHMPVHLGSMPMSVRAAIDALTLEPGDVAILNDPYAGGTHLPDITMVQPVFVPASKAPAFYVSSRAHHADVGGKYPGSMGLCRNIDEEGIRISPMKLVRAGVMDQAVLKMILDAVRTPEERQGDLRAQLGACRVGEMRLLELVERFGGVTSGAKALFPGGSLPQGQRRCATQEQATSKQRDSSQGLLLSRSSRVQELCSELLDYSERLMRAELANMPAGNFAAEDFLDDDGFRSDPIRIAVAIQIDPAKASARVDFSGSSPQVESSMNAVFAITYSATYYVFRCLLPEDAPANAGLMRPISVHAPTRSVVNAEFPAAVAAGNVETSQRIVDVLLRALAQAIPERIPAASSGTMNNLTIGGVDPRTQKPFAYYETIAGGMGARPNADGLSGVHTHMTNSLNTPVEALEYAYPFQVRRYSYRPGSGGAGKFRGGDGLIREIELLADAQVTLMSDRRKFFPYGLAGGEEGKAARAVHEHSEAEQAERAEANAFADKSVRATRFGNESHEIPAKSSLQAKKGDVVRIETPGGGGWGERQH